jgi:hypothetical protein
LRTRGFRPAGGTFVEEVDSIAGSIFLGSVFFLNMAMQMLLKRMAFWAAIDYELRPVKDFEALYNTI